MINYSKGFKLTAPIITTSIKDTFPTHFDELGKGGYRTVELLSDLNLIANDRKKTGMLTYVVENAKIYILTNQGWEVWSSSKSLDDDMESVRNELKLDVLGLRYAIDEIKTLPEDYLITGGINGKTVAVPNLKLKNLPVLGAAKFPLPDLSFLSDPDSIFYKSLLDDWGQGLASDLRNEFLKGIVSCVSILAGTPIPNPSYNALSIADNIMIGPWLPQIYAGAPGFTLNQETAISSSLGFAQINASRTKKILETAGLIVKSKKINWHWDNPFLNSELLDIVQNNIPDSILNRIPGGVTSAASFASSLVTSMYNLDTSYEFKNAQALDELPNGKMVVVNNGELKPAEPGREYVDYHDIGYGLMTTINPAATGTNLPDVLGSNKIIYKSAKSKTRPSKPREFDRPVIIINEQEVVETEEEVFETELFSADKIELRSFSDASFDSDDEGARLLGYNNRGHLVSVVDKTDPLIPVFFTTATLIEIFKYVKSTSPTVAQDLLDKITVLTGIVNILKTLGGTVTDATKAVKTITDTAKTASDTVKTVADVAKIAADALTVVEFEAQVSALAGVTAIGFLAETLAIIGVAAGGAAYGQYIKGQSLSTVNKWDSTDLNDECSNATGAFRPLSITPYRYENRGKGTIWFDSNGRKSGQYNYHSEAGMRLFSWDSSQLIDSELSPLHLGLFGYKKNAFSSDEYKGFAFRAEFDKNSTIEGTGTVFEDDNPNYRFPVKFGLYDVYKKVSSLSQDRHGWNAKDPIFEYDYKNFSFSKPVAVKKIAVSESLSIPLMNSASIPLDSSVGSIFFCSDL